MINLINKYFKETTMGTNIGKNNTGYYNTGDRNTGYYNTGHRNAGHYNTGHRNAGHYNTGNRNTGNRNTGNRNTGDYNSGNFNSGFFNTNEPTVRLFNKDSGLTRDQIEIPYIDLKITEWIPEGKMTDLQKQNDPQFHVKEGTLIERSYQEAWKLAWSEADEELKQSFRDLPNFDEGIFNEITGLDSENKGDCSGKVVEIDGKKYKLTEIE